jgi:tRNA-dihydrouridine synthase
VTDAAFRLTVASHARPDVLFTEFTSVGDVCFGSDGRLESLRYDEAERPIVAQLYGKVPQLFYQAAHVVCELGFDGLDINMGCPSKNVASSGCGAALIKTPVLAHELMQAARRGIADWAAGQSLKEAGLKPSKVAGIEAMLRREGRSVPASRRVIPLSVKTRLGYDTVVIEDWIDHILAERPSAITVHGRTLAQLYRGAADWDAIARAAARVRGSGTLLLGNGDVTTPDDVVRRIRDSGVDGVLIGRGTLGAPWLFASNHEIRTACGGGGVAANERTRADRFAAMLDHARRFESLFGVERFPRMRKHLAWYCKGFPHAAALRARMVRASSTEDVARLLRDYDAAAQPASAVAVACD